MISWMLNKIWAWWAQRLVKPGEPVTKPGALEVYQRMRETDPVTQAIMDVAYDQEYRDWQAYEAEQREKVKPAAFLTPLETPAPGLSPREFLDKHPGRGLIVGGGVNLRHLREILSKPEDERTDWERSIVAARPEVTVESIDRQLRVMKAPSGRTNVVNRPREIDGFTAIEESEHGLELDGSPKQVEP